LIDAAAYTNELFFMIYKPKSYFYMNRFVLFAILLLAMFCNTSDAHSQNFPFPQDLNYKYGNRVKNYEPDSIQKYFDSWIEGFYVEDGNLARVKFDEPWRTVSEGIAYGMLILVYMENEHNDNQSRFDKLWAYYNEKACGKGLMAWNVNGFGEPLDCHAATDAELDVIMALLLAHKQWGSSGAVDYLADAENLIDLVWEAEINKDAYVIQAGDYGRWDTNPSYFITCAIQLFKDFDDDPSHKWQAVIDKCYQLLYANRNASTGLVSDWCDFSGSPVGDFHYDAVRTPWRMAWTYAWYGHDDAYDVAEKIAAWSREKHNDVFDPNTVMSSWTLDGKAREEYGDATFHGAFASSAMVDKKHEEWMNDGYAVLQNFQYDTLTYYNHCLRLLYMLTLTGNTPNFWDMSSVYSSARTSADGTKIYVDFTNNVTVDPETVVSAFSLTKNDGTAVGLASVTLNAEDAKIVELELDIPLLLTDGNLKLTYTEGSMVGLDKSDVPSFGPILIENMMEGGPASLLNATTSKDGAEIALTFDKHLSSVLPDAPAGFFVLASSASVPVASVALDADDDRILVLKLGTVLQAGDVVSVSYSESGMKTTEDGIMLEFSNAEVVNKTLPPGQYGFLEDFDDNTLTNWLDSYSVLETIDEADQILHVKGNCNEEGYVYFFRHFGPTDISENPSLKIDVKASADFTLRIDLMQSQEDGSYLKTNSSAVEKTVSGDGEWATYTYSYGGRFVQKYSDSGQEVNIPMSADSIDGYALYLNPGSCFDGDVYIDNIKLGDVPVPVRVEDVVLSESALDVAVNDQLQLLASVLPANADNKALVWESSDEEIVSVDAYGKLTAIKAGTATVTARSKDVSEVYDEIAITVIDNIPVTQVIELKKGLNLVTLYVTSEDMSASSLFPTAELIRNDSDFWIEQYDADYNTINNLQAGVPYCIFSNVDVTVEVTGQALSGAQSYVLQAGWNFIGYAGDDKTVVDAVQPIASYFEELKGEKGSVLEGETGDFTDLEKGKAYFIKVNRKLILEW